MKYLSWFLSRKSAGDILNVAHPVSNIIKEITEAVAIHQRTLNYLMSDPMKIGLLDLCAGNGLVGLISAFNAPVREVVAIDRKPPTKRGYSQVKKYRYIERDIMKIAESRQPIPPLDYPFIITACHACKNLAPSILKLAHHWQVPCILMPCCIGKITLPNILRTNPRLSKYTQWCLSLGFEFHDKGNVNIYYDRNVLSPCNGIITYQPFNHRS